MNRKKIALVNVFFPPQSIGGATRVIEDNFDLLVERYADDFELVVFTSDSEMHDKPYELECYLHKGVRVYRSSVLFREHMDWHAWDQKMGELFDRFLEFEQPDKIHFHCVQRLTGSIVETAMNRDIPYFITLHDAWWISDFQFLVDEEGKVYPQGHPDPYEEIALPSGITFDESNRRKLYLSKLLQRAEKLFSVSESFKDIYERNGITNIATIRNGISRKIEWRKKETSYTDRVVCGQVGNISPHKGYEILKEAIWIVQPENLEFIFVDHSKEEGYQHKESWGRVPITFIGPVKQKDIVNLYQKLDVLFAPSIWPESFGLVTREAAACGCWVVASNLGGIGEDVTDGENGFVIEPTVKALTKVLQAIDQNSRKYKKIAQFGTIRYADEQVKKLVRYYND